MSERKNINNLFQEKFENFEVVPDQIVWNNIEAKLKEKKKRRVIPFWWKLSGIAAALLIGTFVYNFGFENSNAAFDNGTTVTVKEKNDSKAGNKVSKNNSDKPTLKNNNSINTTEESVANNANTNNSEKNINSLDTDTKSNSSEVVANSTNAKFNKKKSDNNYYQKNNTALTNNSDTENAVAEVNKGKKKNKTKTAIQHNNESVVVENSLKEKNKSIENKTAIISNEEKNNTIVNNTIDRNNKEKNKSIENKTTIISNEEKNNTIVNNTIDRNNSVLSPNSKNDLTPNKKIDSTKIAIVEPNALEELQNEKEKKMITEPKLNRWQVSSNVAPIYFSSLSGGSPLDEGLKNNSKTYSANNQSYGVGASYAINKKIKIRTGVNLLNVDYDTNGILYYQSTEVNSKIANLNLNTPGSLIIIESLSNVNSDFNKVIQKSEGSLNQKMGYIEVPMEMTYTILNKKLGIDFIGGMSTMILSKNEIYLKSSDLNLKIGEANNLNNIHFSGNLGLGFKYGILKNLDARLEPVFKYQINTFSNDSGDFKPFMFGVYSGVNFTF